MSEGGKEGEEGGKRKTTMGGGDQPSAPMKGDEGINVELVESAELPTMHRDVKGEGGRYMERIWRAFEWEDGHEA
jgi:hypothetical protein